MPRLFEFSWLISTHSTFNYNKNIDWTFTTNQISTGDIESSVYKTKKSEDPSECWKRSKRQQMCHETN